MDTTSVKVTQSEKETHETSRAATNINKRPPAFEKTEAHKEFAVK